MDEAAITRTLLESLHETHVITADGVSFFFVGSQRKFPFATIVTSDNDFDRASKLDRPGVFRLNIGIGKASFRARFGPTNTEHDFTALDRLMPHPVYGRMYWVCVLNPSAETFEAIRPLLAEAYAISVERHAERDAPS